MTKLMPQNQEQSLSLKNSSNKEDGIIINSLMDEVKTELNEMNKVFVLLI